MPANHISSLMRVAATAACLVGTSALAATHFVPVEVPTIQAAIALSMDGDEIIVAAGTYHEALNFLGKCITVRSASGASGTIIDATGLGLSTVTFNMAETAATVIEGFTVTGGAGTAYAECQSCRWGGGILCDGASPTIRSCVIVDNHLDVPDSGSDGGGMACLHGANPSLTNCAFRDNSADWGRGGALYVRDCSASITNCTFESNSAAQGGATGSSGSAVVTIYGCVFRNNTVGTPGFGGAIYVSGSWTASSSLFCGNSQPEVVGSSFAEPIENTYAIACPVDTDADGLLDTTENDMAQGSGCPNPNDADSDDDGLNDGAEVAAGTNPCSGDTDGDGLGDATDPTPTVPGAPPEFIEWYIRSLCDQINALPLSAFNGPNNNANSGRRNSLCNRASDAANALHAGNEASATDSLMSLLHKIDGETPPPDWLHDTAQRQSLEAQVVLALALIGY